MKFEEPSSSGPSAERSYYSPNAKKNEDPDMTAGGKRLQLTEKKGEIYTIQE